MVPQQILKYNVVIGVTDVNSACFSSEQKW